MAKRKKNQIRHEPPQRKSKPPCDTFYLFYLHIVYKTEIEGTNILKECLKPGITHEDGCFNRITNIKSEVERGLKKYYNIKGNNVPKFDVCIDFDKSMVVYPVTSPPIPGGFSGRAKAGEDSLLGLGTRIFVNESINDIRELQYVDVYDESVNKIKSIVSEAKGIFGIANVREFAELHPYQKSNKKGCGNIKGYCHKNGILTIKKDRS